MSRQTRRGGRSEPGKRRVTAASRGRVKEMTERTGNAETWRNEKL